MSAAKRQLLACPIARSNVVLGFVSALMQDTTYHVTLEPGADALLAACLISAADQLMQWDSVQWVA